jgi:1-acyl-sn-glycerol-3-phosphate acyltransferase
MSVETLIGSTLCDLARLITGIHPVWRGSTPDARPRVYFVNHRSHIDFVLVWAVLPLELRALTRPVAAADYWLARPLRRYLIERVFRGVVIERTVDRHHANPVELMGTALAAGESLILFPEGTRNQGDGLLPFKPGIHHLAKAYPEVDLVPVWIENLGRVLPKGTLLPVPLLCTMTFGASLRLGGDESREAFLARAHAALLALAPPAD